MLRKTVIYLLTLVLEFFGNLILYLMGMLLRVVMMSILELFLEMFIKILFLKFGMVRNIKNFAN